MELYAAGFNAHRQLLSYPLNTPLQDLHSFQKIASGTSIRVRCAVWSTTCLEIDGQLHLRGFHDSGVTDGIIAGPAAHEMRTVFGDTTGVLGALSTAGEIWTLASSELRFLRREVPVEGWAAREGLMIDDIAIADNDQVCLSTRP